MVQDEVLLSVGAILLAVTLSWGLYGCLISQFYGYYTSPARPGDSKLIQYTVGALCILESGFTIAMTHGAWVRLVDVNGGSVPVLGPWTAALCPTLIGIVICIVQMFFARVIWNLSEKSRIILATTLIIALLALAQGAFCLAFTTKSLQIVYNSQQTSYSEVGRLLELWLVVLLICGNFITLAMITLLWRATMALERAQRVLMKTSIMKSLESGSMVTISTSVGLTLLMRPSARCLVLLPMLSISRLHTMVLLSSLDERSLVPLVVQSRQPTISDSIGKNGA